MICWLPVLHEYDKYELYYNIRYTRAYTGLVHSGGEKPIFTELLLVNLQGC